MILKTKYFDLETDLFIFKDPEQIRKRLENSFKNCFTDKPRADLEYDGPLKISLKYEPTRNYFCTPFPIDSNDLIFSDIGFVNGYKIMDDDYTCRKFHYEHNHTYSIKEDPIPCERGFHFCRELADCFNYYCPSAYIDETCHVAFDLDVFKFFNVKSNGVTYQLWDKCCTNNITILEECATDTILKAFKEWANEEWSGAKLSGAKFKVKLRGKFYFV